MKPGGPIFAEFAAAGNGGVSGDGRESFQALPGVQDFSGDGRRFLEQAKERAALIEQEAYEKGFAQGEKDGYEMGAKRLDKILDRFEEILQKATSQKKEFLKEHEKEILDLINRIAAKVVRGHVKTDQGPLRDAILEALNLATDRTEVTVRVCPDDVEFVKEMRPEFFGRVTDLKSITIESDPGISPGGCFLETSFGHVDARLEIQLERIAEAVERAFEASRVTG